MRRRQYFSRSLSMHMSSLWHACNGSTMKTLYEEYLDELKQNVLLLNTINSIIKVLLTDLPDREKLIEITSMVCGANAVGKEIG